MHGDRPAGPPLLLEEEFTAGSLYALRQAAVVHAAAAGLGQARAADVMLAVHELAANAVRHGAGRGRLLMWRQEGALVCQVRDGGRAGARDGPGADAAASWPYVRGHGLWVVRLAADQMSAVSRPGGTCVTVSFAVR